MERLVEVTTATAAELPELADVAARTFPLACPPSVTEANVAAFIAETLTQAHFARYLDDPDRLVLAARRDGRIIGYAMLIRGVPDDDDVQKAVSVRPAVEISKMYVLADDHGAGASAALMGEAIRGARALGAKCVWLGVNQHNRRAQRFYAKRGFTINGAKTFRLGTEIENDYVMVRPV
ncbi:acetyltransferase [Mycobacteriaceae bacterium 1482268.1]|nr:acetyltransferase [Mycobacteriaceae bacterium 1482268.1]